MSETTKIGKTPKEIRETAKAESSAKATKRTGVENSSTARMSEIREIYSAKVRETAKLRLLALSEEISKRAENLGNSIRNGKFETLENETFFLRENIRLVRDFSAKLSG